MKKNFPLQAEGKHPDRVLEAVKHEIRKYFKRERNRDVPKARSGCLPSACRGKFFFMRGGPKE